MLWLKFPREKISHGSLTQQNRQQVDTFGFHYMGPDLLRPTHTDHCENSPRNL